MVRTDSLLCHSLKMFGLYWFISSTRTPGYWFHSSSSLVLLMSFPLYMVLFLQRVPGYADAPSCRGKSVSITHTSNESSETISEILHWRFPSLWLFFCTSVWSQLVPVMCSPWLNSALCHWESKSRPWWRMVGQLVKTKLITHLSDSRAATSGFLEMYILWHTWMADQSFHISHAVCLCTRWGRQSICVDARRVERFTTLSSSVLLMHQNRSAGFC